MDNLRNLAAALKEKGNAFYKVGDYKSAVESYTEAIEYDPTNAVLYSNRAAAKIPIPHPILNMHDVPFYWLDSALKDAEKACELDPKYEKAWVRKGNILEMMHPFDRQLALEAYRKAAALAPNAIFTRAPIEDLRACMEYEKQQLQWTPTKEMKKLVARVEKKMSKMEDSEIIEPATWESIPHKNGYAILQVLTRGVFGEILGEDTPTTRGIPGILETGARRLLLIGAPHGYDGYMFVFETLFIMSFSFPHRAGLAEVYLTLQMANRRINKASKCAFPTYSQYIPKDCKAFPHALNDDWEILGKIFKNGGLMSQRVVWHYEDMAKLCNPTSGPSLHTIMCHKARSIMGVRMLFVIDDRWSCPDSKLMTTLYDTLRPSKKAMPMGWENLKCPVIGKKSHVQSFAMSKPHVVNGAYKLVFITTSWIDSAGVEEFVAVGRVGVMFQVEIAKFRANPRITDMFWDLIRTAVPTTHQMI